MGKRLFLLFLALLLHLGEGKKGGKGNPACRKMEESEGSVSQDDFPGEACREHLIKINSQQPLSLTFDDFDLTSEYCLLIYTKGKENRRRYGPQSGNRRNRNRRELEEVEEGKERLRSSDENQLRLLELLRKVEEPLGRTKMEGDMDATSRKKRQTTNKYKQKIIKTKGKLVKLDNRIAKLNDKIQKVQGNANKVAKIEAKIKKFQNRKQKLKSKYENQILAQCSREQYDDSYYTNEFMEGSYEYDCSGYWYDSDGDGYDDWDDDLYGTRMGIDKEGGKKKKGKSQHRFCGTDAPTEITVEGKQVTLKIKRNKGSGSNANEETFIPSNVVYDINWEPSTSTP